MLTRRGFLKGLLSSVAAAALVKNGIVQPEQIIAEPDRRIFDMAENTWRRQARRVIRVEDSWRVSYSGLTAWEFKLAPFPRQVDISGMATFTNDDIAGIAAIRRAFSASRPVNLVFRPSDGGDVEYCVPDARIDQFEVRDSGVTVGFRAVGACMVTGV